jgi:phosphoglycolate phosphatase
LCIETTLFPGIDALLADLDARNVRWGIVTNKTARLAVPLVEQLGLKPTAGCVVGGDTTAHAKPHPAPLLHAAQWIGVPAQHIVYVGDDLRDVQAGRAAGMVTVAAAYGYCGTDSPPHAWGADVLVESTEALSDYLKGLSAP